MKKKLTYSVETFKTKMIVLKMSGSSFLESLRANMRKELIPVRSRVYGSENFTMINYSILRDAIEAAGVRDVTPIIKELVGSSTEADRAVGALVCQVVGDSVGHPLEFIPATSDLPPYKQRASGRESFLHPELDPSTGQVAYTYCLNQFRLKPGQWTDDASMALCVADSLLVCGTYIGGDCRSRFHNWWNHGYNNAFRYDTMRPHKNSVGLGGNISKSIDDLLPYDGKGGKDIPAVFRPDGEDAGNGSIMRLSPIPIRFSFNETLGMDVSELHSYGTHPGPDAAQCCRFITFFVTRAIHREKHAGYAGKTSMKDFVDTVVMEYLTTCTVTEKMRAVLTSQPPSRKEACWNWKAERLEIEETLAARGTKYNGHPVSAGYFGAYCMDGLAMALWSLYRATSATECLVRVVNLCGDADTTGAITGQMLGAFYGYTGLASDPMGQRMIANMRQWDPLGEIEIRAVMLYEDGQRAGPTETNQSQYVSPPRPPTPPKVTGYW